MLKKLLLLGVLVVSSCSKEDVSSKDTIKIGVPAEAVTLDPYGSNDNASARVTVNIFDRLLEKDVDGNMQAGLATSWEMTSPTTVKLVIRTNAKFHNGDNLTVEDVKFSIERMLKSAEIEHIVSPIKNVIISSPDTIILNLHAPFAPILSHLAHSAMGIMNKKATEMAGPDVGQQPIGTGPYKLKQWNRGQNIILEMNNDYWGDMAKVPNIIFTVIPEGAARTIALETGDVDLVYDVDSVDRERVLDHNNLQLIEQPIARIEYIGFNIEKNKNTIWKDARVREAVSLAIDRDGIINTVLFGAGTPANSVIYSSVIGHYDGIQTRKQNIEKAKALIAEAGVPAGTKVAMWTSDGPRQKMLEIVQANLKEIGIDASIEVYEWARFLDGTAKGEHDIFVLGWTTVTGDADYGIYNLVHTDAFGGPGNRSFYSNKEVDQLLEDARKEINPVKRNEFYKQIQIILDKELPFFPLFYKLSNVGAAKYVKGFQFDPADAHRLNYVYFQ